MKKLYSILLCICMLPLISVAHPHDITFKKTINKDYSVSSGASFQVNNKYGKLVFHTWNKNEIKASIVITGFGRDEDEAKQQADLVSITDDQRGNTITLITNYKPSQGSSFWNKLFSWGNKSGKQYVNIDYDIYLPASLAHLQMENSFGDVLAEDINAAAAININYCNYRFSNLAATSSIDMNYSNGTINKANNITLHANYCKLTSEEINNINVRSNYGEYHLEKVGKITIHANYDDYTIQSLGDIDLQSDYTNYKIGTLSGSANVKIVYGDFKVNTVANNFGNINIDGTYADIKLGMNENAPFRLDASLSYGDIKTGDINFKNVNNIEKNSHHSFSGVTINATAQSPLIKVNGSYTDVSLKN